MPMPRGCTLTNRLSQSEAGRSRLRVRSSRFPEAALTARRIRLRDRWFRPSTRRRRSAPPRTPRRSRIHAAGRTPCGGSASARSAPPAEAARLPSAAPLAGRWTPGRSATCIRAAAAAPDGVAVVRAVIQQRVDGDRRIHRFRAPETRNGSVAPAINRGLRSARRRPTCRSTGAMLRRRSRSGSSRLPRRYLPVRRRGTAHSARHQLRSHLGRRGRRPRGHQRRQ